MVAPPFYFKKPDKKKLPNVRELFPYIFRLDNRFAVVGFAVQFFDFFNQRIARVAAGALVVKGLFGQLVQICHEFGFGNTRFFDGFGDIQVRFHFFNGFNQANDFHVAIVAAVIGYAQMVCNLGIASFDERITVLRQQALFRRIIRCVIVLPY